MGETASFSGIEGEARHVLAIPSPFGKGTDTVLIVKAVAATAIISLAIEEPNGHTE